MATNSEWWMWPIFFTLIAVMLFVDLFLFGGRKSHRVSTREALSWTIIWFIIALGFNFLFWWYLEHHIGSPLANESALEFLTAYFVEKSLSVDNIFVIVMLFTYFSIPAQYQRRVLIYGVLGAIIMRLVLILVGIWAIDRFHWILYIFGLILLVTGVKMLIFADDKPDLDKNPVLIWMRKHLRITNELHAERFFVVQNKLRYATPLFLVLVLIEVTDLIFAFDSIPAVFAITNDPFIAFTSNIFAILGLRSLYFLLAGMNERFHLLKYGLAFILMFIGGKMLIAHWFKIPTLFSLGVVVAILALSIFLSIHQTNKLKKLNR